MTKKNINEQLLKEHGQHYLNLHTNAGRELQFLQRTGENSVSFRDELGMVKDVDYCVDSESIKRLDKDLLQLVFFFGVSSMKEIEAVFAQANPESLFVFIEPNASLFSYAIEQEDFRMLQKLNYVIVVGDSTMVSETVRELSYSKALLLLRRPVFYFNTYYRKYELSLVKDCVAAITDVIKKRFFRIGNSIHDSLLGLIHNMQNLRALGQSPDVAHLKGAFPGVPAFVVAAGPSLDKNINELKRIDGKGIIIAVDTIAEKLVRNGIVPHFIASVERINVWEYFFQNKPEYYATSYLVAPPVLQPEVVSAFKERVILPMRQSVREYRWLSNVLNLKDDCSIWMGASCTHVAAGFAMHLGASPIVLVGQDLAYGDGDIQKTHADDTEYDTKPEETPEEILTTEGYNGGVVKTQDIWNQFRALYEEKIKRDKLTVINATEGGAKIHGTVQLSLNEAINTYCRQEIDIKAFIESAPKTSIDIKMLSQKMGAYCDELEKISAESLDQLKMLNKINDEWAAFSKEKGLDWILHIMQKTDRFFQVIPRDELLYHNLQGPMTILLQKFHLIPSDGSEKSLKENLLIQIEFCEMFSNTTWLIAQVIQENFPWQQEG